MTTPAPAVPTPELSAAVAAVRVELDREPDPTRRADLANQAAHKVAETRDEAIREAAQVHERMPMGKLARLCGVTEPTATWALAKMRGGPRGV